MAGAHCLKSKLFPFSVVVVFVSAAIVGVGLLIFLTHEDNSASPAKVVTDKQLTDGESDRLDQNEIGQSHVTVSTSYGDVIGLTYKVSDDENVDVFFGIPYAEPPVGKLRLARPEPVTPWSPDVKDATSYPNSCVQEVFAGKGRNVTTMSEDCLYLNIYRPRKTIQGTPSQPLPVMLYIHGGSFRDGSANIFNFTNLATKGVVVVTTNYRLNGFGFLSTEDDVIPGNFGLLDAAQALQFVKRIIDRFHGDPDKVTVFGSSAGSAIVSQMALSPLTKGKFQRAIMQSGAGTSTWASHHPKAPFTPRQVALNLGQRLDCSLPQGQTERDQSLALLSCLRKETAEDMMTQIHSMTVEDYMSQIIFTPVSGDAFGFLPQYPRKMASNSSSLVSIPMIFGWSSNDSSWTVNDPHDKGVNYTNFVGFLSLFISLLYPDQAQAKLEEALQIYNATNSSELSTYDVRDRDVLAQTDLFMESFIVKEARQFSRATVSDKDGTVRADNSMVVPESVANNADSVTDSTDRGKAKTFVYQFDYRPSYKDNPEWQGVTHMDERGMVLGLPTGPNQYTYPVTSEDDRTVADMMTTMWSNFAKYGDPTPQALPGGVKWPEFGHKSSDQNLLLIRPVPEVRRFDRDEPVVLWTGSSGLDN